MKPNLFVPALLTLALMLVVACQHQAARTRTPLKPPEQQTEVRTLPANSSPNLKRLIDGAVEQVGVTTGYDPSYQRLEYPNGDVPLETGVCSDVIVRAFRKASIDLQKDVHEDMKSNFSSYPTKWGLSGTDSNIDHRRVPNLQTFFARKGKQVVSTGSADTFLPGDIVTWDLGGGVDHVGIVVNVWYKPSQRYHRSQYRRRGPDGRRAICVEHHWALSILLEINTEPRANRGPRAGSPRGVVVASGTNISPSRKAEMIIWEG